MEEENTIPHIGKLEDGETFIMNLPECCRLFAEADPTDKDYYQLLDNCPHVTKPIKPIKRNIGL
jgi:hypothetical protein